MDGKAKATATDLLRGGKYPIDFAPEAFFDITLPAWTGVVLKIK
jgi:hypothetical protein